MNIEDFEMLKNDLRTNGYDKKQPIYLYNEKILDGWNRNKACTLLNIVPEFKPFFGSESEAIDFVMRTNKRRNLTSSQWAAIAVEADELIEAVRKEAKERQIRKPANSVPQLIAEQKPEQNETRSIIATAFNTNRTYISDAQRLKDENPMMFEQVKSGAKTITEAKREEKKAEQIERFETLKVKELTVIADNYDVIVIDPPWQMEKIQREVAPLQVGFDYPTMDIDDIKNFELPAGENCHVFMWITHKHLPHGFDIFKAWGVKYVCCFVWHKNGGFQPFGLPQYNCEFVLYGRIGTPEFFDLKDFNVCFNANRTGHSEKPDLFYETIKRVTAGKRIDIFSRRSINGFDKWGNEA